MVNSPDHFLNLQLDQTKLDKNEVKSVGTMLEYFHERMMGGRCFSSSVIMALVGSASLKSGFGDVVNLLFPGFDLPMILIEDGGMFKIVGTKHIPKHFRNKFESNRGAERLFMIS